MPTAVTAARQLLAADAAAALDLAVATSRRRGHSQTTSLHIISVLLSPAASPASPILRDALARARSAVHAPRQQLKALDMCVGVALERLPSSSSPAPADAGAAIDSPPVSNSLMAAIKRSQASQRRNPDAFHFYTAAAAASSSPPTSSASSCRVALLQLLLAILDDPIVSRVFGDAGFRSGDVKVALLRPPAAPLLRSAASSRCPPLFLCSFANESSVVGGALGGGDENRRRVGEVFVSGKNAVLVGAGASDAVDGFCGVVRRREWELLPAELAGAVVVDNVDDVEPAGVVIINVGDLARLADGSGGDTVGAVSRVVELRRGRAMVIGWSETYETYLKFLSRFPLVDNEWDLQLLPITTAKKPSPAMSAPKSLMDSFVPFAGFFATPRAPAPARYDTFAVDDGGAKVGKDAPPPPPPAMSRRPSDAGGGCLSPASSTASVMTDLVLSTPRSGPPKTLPAPAPAPAVRLFGRSHSFAGYSTPATPPSPVIKSGEVSDYKALCKAVFDKVGRQEDAVAAIAGAIVQCRSGGGRRRGGVRGDIWLILHGPDSAGKKKAAMAVADAVYGGDSLIYINLRNEATADELRGKTRTDCVADELRKKPSAVVFLDNTDQADLVLQSAVCRAIDTGKFADSRGREVGIGNSIFMLSAPPAGSAGAGDAAFTESSVSSAQPLPMKLVRESGAAAARRGAAVIAPSEHVTKRKRANWIPFDLNLPVEEMEHDETQSSDDTPPAEQWLDSILDAVDRAVTFVPFDFDALADGILNAMSAALGDTLGAEAGLSVDAPAMSQLLAAEWLSGDRGIAARWVDRVLRSALLALRDVPSSTTKMLRLTTATVAGALTAPPARPAVEQLIPEKLLLE